MPLKPGLVSKSRTALEHGHRMRRQSRVALPRFAQGQFSSTPEQKNCSLVRPFKALVTGRSNSSIAASEALLNAVGVFGGHDARIQSVGLVAGPAGTGLAEAGKRSGGIHRHVPWLAGRCASRQRFHLNIRAGASGCRCHAAKQWIEAGQDRLVGMATTTTNTLRPAGAGSASPGNSPQAHCEGAHRVVINLRNRRRIAAPRAILSRLGLSCTSPKRPPTASPGLVEPSLLGCFSRRKAENKSSRAGSALTRRRTIRRAGCWRPDRSGRPGRRNRPGISA